MSLSGSGDGLRRSGDGDPRSNATGGCAGGGKGCGVVGESWRGDSRSLVLTRGTCRALYVQKPF